MTILIALINLFIVYLIIKSKDNSAYFFLIILGGSLGNLFDRIYYSAVPDFIDISYNDSDSYQAAFLSLFNLTNYDNLIIQQTIDELFITIKDNNEWAELLKEITGKHLLSYDLDPGIGITILLSYDYLALFHKAIQQYHLDKSISLQSLKAQIERK